MALIEWIRPSGTRIKTNDLDATIAYAIRLGWKLVSEAVEVPESIACCSSKDELFAYLDSKGVKIDKRGSLDKLKEKAEAALRGD